MIQQAARDMERDEEVDGFPNGEMAALDFFHSEVFDDLCYGSGIDPDGLLAKLGIPDTSGCQCYQCRRDFTAEATAVAGYNNGGDFWFVPNAKHIVTWENDFIIEVHPIVGEPSGWMTAQEFLRGESCLN